MLNSCAKAPNELPPFFLTVSMMENIEQKLYQPSAERNEHAVFILNLLMRNDRSMLLEKGTLKSVKNRSTSSFSSFCLSRKQRTLPFFGLPRFLIFGSR